MRTEEIINSLKICGGEGTTCQDCAYRNRLELCHKELLKGSALRLEELCDRIEEKEKRIDEARKTIHDLTETNDELKSKLNKGAGLWVSVEERMPFAEYGESDNVLAVCAVGVIYMLYFNGSNWCYPSGVPYCPENKESKITHWMPLPKPPESPKKVKTYNDVYLDRMKEAFPEAVLAGSVTGKCRNKLFGINKLCTYQCRYCWNQPYEEEGEAE